MPDPTPVVVPTPAVPVTAQYPWMLPAFGVAVEGVFIAGMAMAYRLQDATLFNVALGAAIGQAQMVVSYFYGSSAGSAKKDDALAVSAVEKDKLLANSVPVPTITTTTVDPGPPPTATTTTQPAAPQIKTEGPKL
jgi:hypothetical protein